MPLHGHYLFYLSVLIKRLAHILYHTYTTGEKYHQKIKNKDSSFSDRPTCGLQLGWYSKTHKKKSLTPLLI